MRCFVRSLPVLLLFVIPLLPASTLGQVGPPAGMIYANDILFRTVGTPTSLPDHGKFDTLYALGGDLAAVSESAPGDPDYNGGRWEVREITFVGIEPVQYTNAEQVLAAAEAGDIEIGDVVRRFQCPLIRAREGDRIR
jgi:hypothetical protein